MTRIAWLAVAACWRADPPRVPAPKPPVIREVPHRSSAAPIARTQPIYTSTVFRLKRDKLLSDTGQPRCATLPDIPDVVIEYSVLAKSVTVNGQAWNLGPLGPGGQLSAWETAGAAPRQIGVFFWGGNGGGNGLMLVVERDSANAITCSGGYRYRGTVRY